MIKEEEEEAAADWLIDDLMITTMLTKFLRTQCRLIIWCPVPVKNGAHSSTVGAASVDVEARRQQDAVFHRYWAMREWGDKEFVPAWKKKKKQKKKCDLSIL